MTQPLANMHDIRRTLALIYEPQRLYEVRILTMGYTGTVSGYFDSEHFDTTADTIAPWSGKAPVYATLNPCASSLFARSANRLTQRAKYTTSDADIIHRRWLPIDFDPVRPAGISSTDAEHEAALQRAQAYRDWLCGNWGWPAPVYADSGNGAHVLSRIDLPNDEASRALIKGCLEAVALYFSDHMVTVDLTTSNAARIWKVYGTLACKGDNLPERPHRLARLFDVPDPLTVVTREQLEALAALVPEPPQKPARSSYDKREAFNLEAWIAAHGVPVVSHRPWNNSGYRWILNPCPWNNAHTNKAAFIVQLANGAIAAGCHHNGCQGNDWHALRDLYEPDWRAYRDNPPHLSISGRVGHGQAPPHTETPEGDNSLNSLFSPMPWPELAEEAYHGLAGKIVRTIEPQTESDPVALLVQLLIMTGNCIGRIPYYTVEATRHYLNLFATLVGKSSKARKGTSADHIKLLLKGVDPAWSTRVLGGLSSGEGVIWHVRDPVYGQNKKGEEVCLDEGVEDKRLCILETEFARALAKTGQEGNVLSAVLRQAWDHGDLRTLVSGRQKAPVTASNAHVSMCAHITADEVRRLLTDTEAANGFGNRFLWVCVQRSKYLARGGCYPEEALRPLVAELAAAVLHARQVTRMHRTEAAEQRWEAIYIGMAEEQPGLLGAITARAEAQVLRLSCLYALLDQTDTVEVSHLNAAYALWRYCEDSARHIFGEILGDPLADELRRMLRLAGQGGLTRTDINNALGRHVKSTLIGQALARLQRDGFARVATQKTSGRPVEIWYAMTPRVCVHGEKSEKSEKSLLPPAPIMEDTPLNSLHSHTQGAHARTAQRAGQTACLNCGELLEAPASVLGFEALMASALWCVTCGKAGSFRTLIQLDGTKVYLCNTCDTEVRQKRTTTPPLRNTPQALDDVPLAEQPSSKREDIYDEVTI